MARGIRVAIWSFLKTNEGNMAILKQFISKLLFFIKPFWLFKMLKRIIPTRPLRAVLAQFEKTKKSYEIRRLKKNFIY